MQLLIRSKPHPEESLSSFLQRIATLNYVDTHDLWRLLNSNKHYPQSSCSAPIDIYPSSLIDIERFSGLLNISAEALERLTFVPVFIKLGISKQDGSNTRILSGVIDRHRKFCPECLQENKIYKLIWQVHDINYCSTHKTLLMNSCPRCKRQLTILPNKGEIGFCPCCYASLSDSDTINYEASLSELRLLNDWQYILDYNQKGLLNIKNCSPEQSVAIKLLYLLDNSTYLPANEKFVISRLKQSARNTKISQTNIHLDTVFHVIRKCAITMKDFLLLDVPDNFTDSFFERKSRQIERCYCLAPWCKNYRVPGSLVRTATSIHEMKSGEKQKYYMYCNKCGTEFCIDENDRLVERGTQIGFAWSQVKDLLLEKPSIQKMIAMLNTTEDKLKREIIYLAANNLIDKCYVPYKIPASHNPDIVFEIIKHIAAVKQIRVKLNLNYNDFLYYWFCSDIKIAYLQTRVSRPMMQSPKDLRIQKFELAISTLMASNVDITIKSVCNALGISPETLRNWGLLEQVKECKKVQKEMNDKEFADTIIIKTEELVRSLLDSNIRVSSEGFYKLLGVRRTVLVRNHPDLTRYIHEKLSLIN